MAKSNVQNLAELEDANIIDSDFRDVTELTGDIDDTVSSITSEFDADENDVVLLIKVYRVEEKTGKSNWLFNCQPEELPVMERLRDSYGSGIYQVRVYKNKKLYRRFSYPIEAPKIVPITDHKNEFAQIISMMGAQQEKQFAQLKELMLVNRNVVPVQQPFDMMQMMTGMVAMMVQMKALTASPVLGNQTDSIDTALKIVELVNSNKGESGETSMMDILRDVIKSPLINKVIEGAVNIPDQMINAPTKLPANFTAQKTLPNDSIASKTQNNPEQEHSKNGDNMINPIVKGYINQLIKKAAQGSDPGLYAEFILDNVPENIVREYIVRQDLMDFITKINPQAAQYSEWFGELKNNIEEILNGDVQENLTDDAPGNDTLTNEPNSATVPINGDSQR